MEREEYYCSLKDSIYTLKKHCARFSNCKGCCFDRPLNPCIFRDMPSGWDTEWMEKMIHEQSSFEGAL